MKAHILFDFLHVLFFSLKSYYILGIPMYVFILPVLFVAAYVSISFNKKEKVGRFTTTNFPQMI
ncbi:hypothetical protein R6231_18520 [Bacillus cytotoxicus]|nr:hypothetical protein [Bacillus cytotoxicus]AWC27306.1 hypothetical protein CG483_002045 [Bacillus cytotoxicus]AWC39419.1 hypothetical protein CG480_002040 [Bacillus cytotoxicus]AWC47350.1 hypothetical protein CG478_002040 [Bacillus cytotoxicus]AWC51372.1 hypothetical protein CG477_002040 [Bacillus cytotoxicus]AWC55501.1 hypothetical protein CG476_002040 [Bacillus cytotoxicus]